MSWVIYIEVVFLNVCRRIVGSNRPHSFGGKGKAFSEGDEGIFFVGFFCYEFSFMDCFVLCLMKLGWWRVFGNEAVEFAATSRMRRIGNVGKAHNWNTARINEGF